MSLKHAARVLQQGGIVAYAAEYCFGLGCDPRNRAAVAKLLRLKRRSIAKGLIVLAADTRQLEPYIEAFPREALASWPGPHTWLLAARVGTPYWLTGKHPAIAVRVTAHAQAAALCRIAHMALVSTSANRTGGKPARTWREVVKRFGKRVDYVLPGHVGELAAPTSIRDGASGKLIRPG
jgi:L-threonylcarbamoyladenylate synthase